MLHPISAAKHLPAAATALGCTSAAYLPPELGVTPAELPALVLYDAFTALWQDAAARS
jgi:hypothetical protein